MKQRVTITQGPDAKLSITFRFDALDPRAEQIFASVAEFFKHVLTAEEQEELLANVAKERAKLKTGGAA